ncbi:hypothetical protein Taro_022506 [Colocasia esculenta]|uniref:HTH OST-type domain-containing protein n=1 Tax=Colocasia esculenta TaxID=4460 RepID=A0A843VBL4_COLES|nr:hypothetical protein [Colocasia esculenta]
MMTSSNPSEIVNPETSNTIGTVSTNSNMDRTPAPNQQNRILDGPVAILWDIENCPVPSDVRAEDVAGNIRMALRVHPVIKGAVTAFAAYGDFNSFPRRLREGCQRTGVKLVDVPNGRKDAADKAILVDMFLFALDNPPPSSILLISGDVDFAPALHILGQRGYTVILVIPANVGVASALSNAGRFVWDWPSVARGDGFVPPKGLVPRGPNLACYRMTGHLNETPDCQNEDEAIIYRGTSQNEYSAYSNSSRFYGFSSHFSRELPRTSHSLTEYNCTNAIPVPCVPSSRCQSLPSGLSDSPMEHDNMQGQTLWVQPGDLQGLKGQLTRLLEMSGGSLPLVRVPAEYLRTYGRPLYVAEYGTYKLVNLINKMADAFTIAGKGNKKVVLHRNSIGRQEKAGTCMPSLDGRDKKGKGAQVETIDICVCPNMGSSSDDFSDDDKAGVLEESNMLGPSYEFDYHVESFRQEMQELLVCYSCRLLLSNFEALYEQRYKKSLDYQSFGVSSLEELIEKVRDVVVLLEESGSKRKFLVSSCVSG